MIGQLFLVLSLYPALVNAGIFPRAQEDPELLFKSYFSQLPETLRVGYPDKGLDPLDPWYPRDELTISVEFNNYTSVFDFRFFSSKLVGFSEFNVTEFDLTMDNFTSDIDVKFLELIPEFQFIGFFDCKGFIGNETGNCSGILEIPKVDGTSVVRDITYMATLNNETYRFKGMEVETMAEKPAVIYFRYDTPKNVADMIKDNLKHFVEEVFSMVVMNYELKEMEIGEELLTELQIN